MFKLNAIVKTKKGEEVKPFLVQNDFVYCFTKNKGIVIKVFSDFDFTTENKKQDYIVMPVGKVIMENEKTKDNIEVKPIESIKPIEPIPIVEPTKPIPIVEPTPTIPPGTTIPDEDYI